MISTEESTKLKDYWGETTYLLSNACAIPVIRAVPPTIRTACRYFFIFSSPPAARVLLKIATSRGSLLASKETSIGRPPGYRDAWICGGEAFRAADFPFPSTSISSVTCPGPLAMPVVLVTGTSSPGGLVSWRSGLGVLATARPHPIEGVKTERGG